MKGEETAKNRDYIAFFLAKSTCAGSRWNPWSSNTLEVSLDPKHRTKTISPKDANENSSLRI